MSLKQGRRKQGGTGVFSPKLIFQARECIPRLMQKLPRDFCKMYGVV